MLNGLKIFALGVLFADLLSFGSMLEAKNRGIKTIAFCGSGGDLANIADIALQVPSDSTPHIQECHICIGHIICGLVEQNIFPKEDRSV